jgi:hypothetical protein
MIANGNFVNGPTINTHAPSTIFLRNQNNRNSARTKAFLYILVVQKLLDLSLNFLSLFWIGLYAAQFGNVAPRIKLI